MSVRSAFRLLLALGLAGAMLPRAFAAAPPELLRRRLETVHPALRALRARIRAARGELEQSGRRPNPSLGIELEQIGGGAGRPPADAEWTLSFSRPLEARSLRRARRREGEAELAGLEHRLEATRAELAGELAMRWFTCAAETARLGRCREALGLIEEGVAAVRARLEAGAASRLEVLRSRGEALGLAASCRETEARLATARLALARLVQLPESDLPPPEIPSASSHVLPDLDGTLTTLARHPAVEGARTEVDAARAALAKVRAEALGEREFETGLRRLGREGTTFTVGFRLPLRVSDRKRGATAAARARWEEAKADVDAERLGLETRLIELHGELRSRQASLAVLTDDALPTARSAAALAMEGYRRGKFTFLEFLEAQKALVELQIRLAELQGEWCSLLGRWLALTTWPRVERRRP